MLLFKYSEFEGCGRKVRIMPTFLVCQLNSGCLDIVKNVCLRYSRQARCGGYVVEGGARVVVIC